MAAPSGLVAARERVVLSVPRHTLTLGLVSPAEIRGDDVRLSGVRARAGRSVTGVECRVGLVAPTVTRWAVLT